MIKKNYGDLRYSKPFTTAHWSRDVVVTLNQTSLTLIQRRSNVSVHLVMIKYGAESL